MGGRGMIAGLDDHPVGDGGADSAKRASVDALEAVDELLGEGFAGLGPEETAADAAVFFDREGEG
jgi:hypothetical protein